MQRIKGKALTDQTVNLDTKAIRQSSVFDIDDNTTNPLWKLLNIATAKDLRAKQVLNLTEETKQRLFFEVKAVFAANVSNLSSAGTAIDGYTFVNGDKVLLIGQSTAMQNGVYTWATGGVLTRDTNFNAATANTLKNIGVSLNGRMIRVLNGTVYQSDFFILASTSVNFPIPDTDVLSFVRESNKFADSTQGLKVLNNLIQLKIQNTGGGYSPSLKIDGSGNLYIDETLLPGFSGSLSVENAIGTVLGLASKMRFGADFVPTWDGANSRLTLALAERSSNILEDFLVQSPSFIEPTTGDFVFSGVSLLASGAGATRAFLANDSGFNDVVGVFRNRINTGNTFIGHFSLNLRNDVHAAQTGIAWQVRQKVRFGTSGAIPANMMMILGVATAAPTGTGLVEPVNGIYLYAISTENGGRIQAVTSAASVRTKVDTGITISNAAYYDFRVVWDKTNALFYNGNTLLATISTNLPSVLSRPQATFGKVTGSAPAADYDVLTDFFGYFFTR